MTKSAKFCGQCGTPNVADAPAAPEAAKRDVTLVDIPNGQLGLVGALQVAGLALLALIIRQGGALSALERFNVNVLKGKLDNNILWWVGFGLGLALVFAAVGLLVKAMKEAPKVETQI